MRRRELLMLLGTVVTAAGAVRAQQKTTPVIGFLSSASPGPFAPFLTALRDGLSGAGYVEGQNVVIEYRWAEGHYDRLPALAVDLVGRKVDLIIASGGAPSARAAKDATSTIPIVFTTVSDPVVRGLVPSLARPGGNLTGFSIMGTELMPKRLQLLFDLVPQVSVIAVLLNPDIEIADDVVKDMQEAANARGIQLRVLNATTDSEIDTAFANLSELRAGALLVGDDPFFTSRRNEIVALASSHAVPAIYQWRDFAVAGGLISYGVSLAALYRLSGIAAGKILKGTKPADLPVEQPAVFELVINLKTAKALGLTVPALLLAQADEVIE
jgi:putative ABC transport system substrate-binding protein